MLLTRPHTHKIILLINIQHPPGSSLARSLAPASAWPSFHLRFHQSCLAKLNRDIKFPSGLKIPISLLLLIHLLNVTCEIWCLQLTKINKSLKFKKKEWLKPKLFPKFQNFSLSRKIRPFWCVQLLYIYIFWDFSLALAALKNCHRRCTGSFSRILKKQKINEGWAVFCSVSEDPCLTRGRRIDAACRLPSAPLKCPWASGRNLGHPETISSKQTGL